MGKRGAIAALALGATGFVLYRLRRQILARLLRLPPVQNEVTVVQGLRVPMPDGVSLAADHYSPRPGGSFPTILIRSPYGRGLRAGYIGLGWVLVAQRFAERGYHVVVQDTRGRFDSGGQYEPLVHEAADGRATLDWIARQPWCDGTIGMWGPSYLGYAQWAAAVDGPAHLQAIVPIIALSRGYSAGYVDGTPALDTALQAMLIFDTTDRSKWPPKEAKWRWQHREEILARAFRHLPLLEADTIVAGEPQPFYRQGLAHPRPDDTFWQASDHHAKLDRVTAPAHLISGWYDLFLDELLSDYATLKAAGRAPYLTIGPWYHMDLRWMPEAVREALAWFDAHLKGDPRYLREHPVRIYIMGAEAWRELESWPPPAVETRCFLQAQGGLSTRTPDPSSPPDHYRYDPADPTPGLRGPLLLPPAGPVDNRPLEARPDVLCYSSTALSADVEVIGAIRLELYVRSSLAHTDFFGRLCDVYPDGRSINICEGLFRVEPGRGEQRDDGTLRIEVDMWATAHRFLRGHRIRLQVSSGAHPRWARNLGSAEPAATATTMVAAEQTIYHDPARPSALILPVTGGGRWQEG